ncbi:DUF116 domain-containing protein [Methanolobus zinderi]|uniref:DUF116 domain-containing protein n=1 Tax=Methanolobus zinderi TaxID=536044 RepID=A0A7D5E5Y0_9EURY|nr:DUF116 domain-containing protein [Methanolobus zinderi]QLC49453.1 DUF116 domain-containing protein [Methanolobus zinderi]
MTIPYDFLGKVFIIISLLVIAGILLALVLGAYSYKKRKILFPNFTLFVLYLFYGPAKIICRVFFINDAIVDEILVEVRNAVMIDKFKKTKGNRAIFLPQCMRHPNCKARCDPIKGYECKMCGLCDISRIHEAAKEHEFDVYIIPGGSFVKKIIKTQRPESCIGVACYPELTESMQGASPFMVVQGVALIQDGCFDTKVDVDEVIRKMEECDV